MAEITGDNRKTNKKGVIGASWLLGTQEDRKALKFSGQLPQQNSFFSCTGWPVTDEDSGALASSWSI